MALLEELYSLQGKVAIATGAGGVLGGVLVRGLVGAGAKVVLLDRTLEPAEALANEIKAEGGEALALYTDVLDRDVLLENRAKILEQFGRIDILVNLAGGNMARATVQPDGTFFDVPADAMHDAFNLNWMGSVLPSQVFGESMAQQGEGVIINISSMTAQRPLTRVVAYGSAKAAIDNFTRWLAVELSQKYGDGLRVNAIAPGFFITHQNRALLTNEDGSLTKRGQQVIDHTPAGKFGNPDDLISALLFLCGPGARFVNGVVVPVDGGFNAYSGV